MTSYRLAFKRWVARRRMNRWLRNQPPPNLRYHADQDSILTKEDVERMLGGR